MSDEVGLAIFFAIETASESFGSGGGGGTSFAVVIVRATCLWIRLAAGESGRMRAASEAAGKRPIIDKGIWNAAALYIAAAITATTKHLAILPSFWWPYIFPFFFLSISLLTPTWFGYTQRLRDFYLNWTNYILQQLQRKFWKIANALFRIS
jgi:hypothetical protein